MLHNLGFKAAYAYLCLCTRLVFSLVFLSLCLSESVNSCQFLHLVNVCLKAKTPFAFPCYVSLVLRHRHCKWVTGSPLSDCVYMCQDAELLFQSSITNFWANFVMSLLPTHCCCRCVKHALFTPSPFHSFLITGPHMLCSHLPVLTVS